VLCCGLVNIYCLPNAQMELTAKNSPTKGILEVVGLHKINSSNGSKMQNCDGSCG